ncbi:hypothetical protein [Elizabethkingia anophelis]|uniref:hypothetical protein n=1 Tax=Elizabethkingia anophelis TaxID=1117645 RepID=UPI000D026463|nr:hypothetical protein [Elizabethkingia anophelis]MCL1689414.1 hypothetical protein [Elizabethkingia anophelis]MDV4009456.1 hypothetical protein [Elizabethkingia anophelis]MYY49940.1 hypothetical protein [Elizabethkingia anophelis]PRQ84647.1 hypothetical protein CMT87_09040 [Elizabethkingia anophelis]PRQ85849.1 hypothetical protein CMT86_14255 [Elizabethkingia anophelis]
MSELYPEEIKEYNRLTKGMEFTFMALTASFLSHCENVIFGYKEPELSFFCYHFCYSNGYLKEVYEKFGERLEYVCSEVDSRYNNLRDNLSNLLILLREPKARVDDLKYQQSNLDYWYHLASTDETLKNHRYFRKYVM